ncbi:uncharacterized protein LOC144925662 [Branchiostoma floridae x Branchiostoma belcheri]
MFSGADPVGLWPLNALHGSSDVTGNGNDAVATGTQLAPGPYESVDGAFLFSGSESSYIDIPNNGRLDVRFSYTILAHIFPTGEHGPIVDYVGSDGSWAVHLWQITPTSLLMRAVNRDGLVQPSVVADMLQQNTWNYVGGTYNSFTGVEAIWYDGALVGQTHVGVAEVASQYPIRVAVRDGDSRVFAGRIACLQLYNYAMTQEQIAAARDKCRVCPTSGYVSFNGVCYKDFAEQKKYNEAGQRCAEDGALLAMPKDSATNTFISDLSDGSRWLGLTDASNEGQWMFEDGQTLESSGYSNWYPGQPDNFATGEDCVELVSLWNDAKCDATRGFVCQAVQCPLQTAPINGAVTGSNSYYYQSTVLFSCDPGYALVGATSSTCQADGTWSDSVPICSACLDPLGMESGAIPDASITASTTWDDILYRQPHHARLNGVDGYGAWAARTNTIGQWLQVDLGMMMRVSGTIIQGRLYSSLERTDWVTSFKLQYGVDGASWVTHADSDGSDKVFAGNTDTVTPVTNLLDHPVAARYVRFVVQSWHDWIGMRVEVLGCNICQIPDYVSFNGGCYKDFAEQKTYHEARQRCAEDGGLLAMPKDSATNTFISGLRDGSRWLGFTDASSEGQWMFEDGQPLESSGYHNWNPGEPNNLSEEDCAILLSQGPAWNDGKCDSTNGFVCQIDINACLANPCDAQATCTDNPPPALDATCTCNTGYTGDGLASGTGCSDVDACLANPCDAQATCTDNPPPALDATCICNTGYTGDGLT